MPSFTHFSAKPREGATHDANFFASMPERMPLSSEELERTAELVAGGELPLPEYLPDEQLAQLAQQVQQLRRRKLARYITRAIAMNIHCERGRNDGGAKHAQTKLRSAEAVQGSRVPADERPETEPAES